MARENQATEPAHESSLTSSIDDPSRVTTVPDRQSAHSYLFRVLGESVQGEVSALREWEFDQSAYRSLLVQIQKLASDEALKVAAWLDESPPDEDIPAALRVEYGVAHARGLPAPPLGYKPPEIPRTHPPEGEPQQAASLVRPAVSPGVRVPPTQEASPPNPGPCPTTPLYHFTDVVNVPSIRRHGLLSWPQLDARGIDYRPASNSLSRELDQRRNLAGFVRLTLRPEHPMAWRALHEGRVGPLVWLQVDGIVGRWRTTRFSDGNAASSGATVNADWRTAFQSQDPQAEVLVRGWLHPRWITFPPAREKE